MADNTGGLGVFGIGAGLLGLVSSAMKVLKDGVKEAMKKDGVVLFYIGLAMAFSGFIAPVAFEIADPKGIALKHADVISLVIPIVGLFLMIISCLDHQKRREKQQSTSPIQYYAPSTHSIFLTM